MASDLYNRGTYRIVNQNFNWTSTSVGVLLVTSTYTPAYTHNFVSDITNELTGGGYARLTAIASRTITEDDTNHRVILDGADIQFPSLGAAAGTPQYAIIYDNTNGTDATRDLVGYIDLGTPPTPDGNNYNIAWDTVGLWVIDNDAA